MFDGVLVDGDDAHAVSVGADLTANSGRHHELNLKLGRDDDRLRESRFGPCEDKHVIHTSVKWQKS